MSVMSASTSYVNGSCSSIAFQAKLFSVLRPYLVYLLFGNGKAAENSKKNLALLF